MSLIQNLKEGDIDIQAFSLFFNADAATEIPRRLNLPVHSLSHYEQYLEALKSVYTQTTGTVTVDGIAVKPVTVAVRDAIDTAILGNYKTQLEQQIASVAGGRKSYKTYAEMVAKKAEITANSIVDITNDTVENNGAYNYDGTTFTKSIYDPLTQAKTYTDTAKTAAISTAATDATNKANAAKLYADNIPKLANKVISSNATAKKLQGVSIGTDYSVTPSIKYIGYGNISKHSHLIKVKPNTTYTLLVNKIISKLHVSSFDSDQDTWFKSQAPQKYELITAVTMAEARRYYTFTTGANTNYVVTEFDNDSTDPNFVVCEGAYNVSMWDSFNALAFDKSLNLAELSADTIKSKMFSESKNLAQHFIYGQKVSSTLALNTPSSVAYRSVSAWNAANKDIIVSVLVNVKPNTTYTISKEPSDCFRIALKDSVADSGIVVLRDASLSSYTLTTGATDDILCVQVSENYERPRVQIELGDKATEYESGGVKFADAALPLGKKLTERESPVDNTYMRLGIQTDKYTYPLNKLPTYTTELILNEFYQPLLAEYPHLVTKNLLGKDASGLYDIYEYVFEPDSYEQTIFITSGMHPTEGVPAFALGILLNEAYRNPDRHEGLAYLRNKVKIIVIPVVNPWGMNMDPKIVLTHYKNFNSVNINRNFPTRWEVNATDGNYGTKGSSPLSESEARIIYEVFHREKDNLDMYLDLHTAEARVADMAVYYNYQDNVFRPIVESVVSMHNDLVRNELNREPVNDIVDAPKGTARHYAWRVLDIAGATIEYGTGSTRKLGSEQTTFYTDQLFNFVHYGLKAKLKDKQRKMKQDEENKQYISLYGAMEAHSDILNTAWTYSQWQINMYNKIGLTRSVVGTASGTYELVKYVHTPNGYKNTIVLSAGLRGMNRKSVTGLGFFAHILMTSTNPHIIALRNNTRFIFLPCLNPYGFDNEKLTNANNINPYVNFATSTQPEAVALRSFINSEIVDLYVDIDSNYTLFNPAKPTGFADFQVIYNNKADSDYQSTFAVLNDKYGVSPNTNASNYSGELAKSDISAYITNKGVAYSYMFLAQFVLPKFEGDYIDYGYGADELAYCAEVMLNSIADIDKKLSLIKYLAAI